MEELWEVLRPEEQIELKLRKLYTQHHFQPYHLNNFEEYGDHHYFYWKRWSNNGIEAGCDVVNC